MPVLEKEFREAMRAGEQAGSRYMLETPREAAFGDEPRRQVASTMQLAAQLGYASVPAFSAAFRQVTGRTPSEFGRRE